MIKLSNENSDMLKNIIQDVKNKQMINDLVSEVLEIKVKDIRYEDIKKFENISEYEFSIVKARCILDEDDSIDIYFKVIKKDKIKESIFCYWCLLYEDCMRNNKESMNMSTIINKVNISEIGMKRFKNSVFLQIENNKTNILNYGTEVHFIDFVKYIENFQNVSNKIGEWKKYLGDDNDDILMIGVVLNKKIGRSNIEIV